MRVYTCELNLFALLIWRVAILFYFLRVRVYAANLILPPQIAFGEVCSINLKVDLLINLLFLVRFCVIRTVSKQMCFFSMLFGVYSICCFFFFFLKRTTKLCVNFRLFWNSTEFCQRSSNYIYKANVQSAKPTFTAVFMEIVLW